MSAPAPMPSIAAAPSRRAPSRELSSVRRMPPQHAQSVVLGHPVVQVPSEPQRDDRVHLGAVEVAGQHRRTREVAQERFEVVDVTSRLAQAHTLRGQIGRLLRGTGEDRMHRPGLHQLDRGFVLVEL